MVVGSCLDFKTVIFPASLLGDVDFIHDFRFCSLIITVSKLVIVIYALKNLFFKSF